MQVMLVVSKRNIPPDSQADVRPQGAAPRWFRSTWCLSLTSAVLLWAALPPLHWPWLAWVAPVGWLLLVRQPQLSGRRPCLVIWLTGFAFWLTNLHGIRLAHWALWFGWIALAFYLAFYVPLFVAVTRAAVQRLRVPLMVAAPVTWTGLELLRGYLLTGFSGGLLGHSQVRWTMLIQLADTFGAYGVSFLVMFVSAGVARLMPLAPPANSPRDRWTFWPVAAIVLAVASTLGYGRYRLDEPLPRAGQMPVKVALIQEAVDTDFDAPPERSYETFQLYRDLTRRACADNPDLQLVVWPESAFTAGTPELLYSDEADAPPVGSPYSLAEFRDRAHTQSLAFANKTQSLMATLNPGELAPDNDRGVALLAGSDTFDLTGPTPRIYNTAILIRPSGTVGGRYFKMHPVMFGEYIPFGDSIPWLYRVTPLGGGLTPGDRPQVFRAGGLTFSPSICFESTVPHLIQRQVRQLARDGTPPDVLVNVTNDGWFWGSSILDMQFHCAVFRAVENRRPFLIAANTGISAWIDGRGQIVRESPRRRPDVIIADVEPDGRFGLYQAWGDLPAWFCFGLTVLFGLAAKFRKREASGEKDRRPAGAARE